MAKCHPGEFFGEIYAATPGAVLNISVVAETDSLIMMMNVKRLMASCSSACEHHQRLIRNLVGVLANKVMAFNEKITHISKRSTREKILSYLSREAQRQGSLSFDIPFNRQELADYLCVERGSRECFIGMTDPSARKLLPADIMSFSIPFKRFLEMEENADKSFFHTGTWQTICQRLD